MISHPFLMVKLIPEKFRNKALPQHSRHPDQSNDPPRGTALFAAAAVPLFPDTPAQNCPKGIHEQIVQVGDAEAEKLADFDQ